MRNIARAPFKSSEPLKKKADVQSMSLCAWCKRKLMVVAHLSSSVTVKAGSMSLFMASKVSEGGPGSGRGGAQRESLAITSVSMCFESRH
eukprot:15045073-Alexandrium_andersonii.AAC.1